jgi:hypothetical protein
MDVSNLWFGLLGALITVYAFKQQAIPEFRPLYDVTSERAQLITLQDQIKQVSANSIKAPAKDRTELLKNLQDESNRLSGKIHRNELLSRGLGILFYVVLGGVFAGFFADDIKIEDVGDAPKALLIGSAWTSYLSALGLRGEASNREQLAQSIEQTFEKVAEVAPQVQEAMASVASADADAPEAETAPQEVDELLGEVKASVTEDLAKIQAA